MPNFKSDTITAHELAASRAGKYVKDAPLISGSLHFIQAKLTIPAGTAAADTIELAKIPENVTIIPGLSSIVGAAAGAGTVALGFTGETSAVSTATSISAAGKKELVGNIGSYLNTSNRTLIATLAGAGLTAAVVVYFNIACVKAE